MLVYKVFFKLKEFCR